MGAGSREALSTLAQPGPEQQDAPLNEQERKLIARLFSDPTYFPVEFRTWIRTYLESSDIRLPSSAIVGGNAPRVNLPAGVILPFAGPTIPTNTLLCNGQSVQRDEYDLLFQAIGTTWGTLSGSTFSVPDLRDRALYGAGSVVGFAATDGRALGSRGGPNHKHHFTDTKTVDVDGGTDNPGNHTHSVPGAWGQGFGFLRSGSGFTYMEPVAGGMGGAGGHSHSVSASGSVSVDGDTTGGYDMNRPSFAGINYIIATGK